MKTAPTVLALAIAPLFVVGCEERKTPVGPPALSEAELRASRQRQRLKDIGTVRDTARDIVGNPRNWKRQAATLADYQTAASRIGIADRPAVPAFQKAATDMVAYGTQMVDMDEKAFRAAQVATEQLESSLRASFSAMAAPVPAQVPGNVQARANVDYDKAQKESHSQVAALAHQLYGSLNKQASDEFREKCQSLADAYWKLLDCLAACEREEVK
ncbi:MAG: hypothetical protein Q8L55_08270 [Phycisphaerales bacterium]|nr:hypothetical protein [Phycisphaerales bacterium]